MIAETITAEGPDSLTKATRIFQYLGSSQLSGNAAIEVVNTIIGYLEDYKEEL